MGRPGDGDMTTRARGLRNLRAALAPVAAGVCVMAATAAVLIPVLGGGDGPAPRPAPYGTHSARADAAAADCTPPTPPRACGPPLRAARRWTGSRPGGG